MILQTIGQTPLINIEGIYAKLETYNPSGSVKDRMADYIISEAEKRGELKSGQEILEVTSGNTGVALAMISAIKGYKFTAVMPESMSLARRKMMKKFGANLVLTPAKEDIAGAVKVYNKLAEDKKFYLSKQFFNLDNIKAHYSGLGQEIIKQAGKVDVFIAGAGTGGTLIGVGMALKELYPKVKIVAIEPAESAVLSGGRPGLHGIQGIEEGFVPELLKENLSLIDEVVTISSKEAIEASDYLSKKHGLLVGISSGANFLGARKYSGLGKKVVTVFADRGERYL